MIFRHNKSGKGSIPGSRIGVLGLAPRVGTTHIAVAISNYLSEYEKKRVILLEENRHDDIGVLALSLGAKEINEPFSFHRVTYVPHSCPKDSGVMKDLSGCFVVQDLGCDFKQGLSKIMLCDIKILVGNEGSWRIHEYAKLSEISTGGFLSTWRLFVNLGNVKKLKEKDGYGLTVCCFPFEPEPVYPGQETISLLREAIYG